MEVSRIVKVTLNMGVGEAVVDRKALILGWRNFISGKPDVEKICRWFQDKGWLPNRLQSHSP